MTYLKIIFLGYVIKLNVKVVLHGNRLYCKFFVIRI